MSLKIILVIAAVLLTTPCFADVDLSANGYDGSMGQSGDDAGNISVTLSKSKTYITVKGQVDGEGVTEQIPLTGTNLGLYALGGDGGNGYSGVDGEPGYDGRDGADGRRGHRGENGRRGHNGTRHSPDGQDGQSGTKGGRGSEGHPGENGGDGTNGTSGTDAGHGGNGGRIQVHAKDLSLFMVVNSRAWSGDGGTGGRAGVGGRSGIGGDGGDGGHGGPGGKGGRGGSGYNCSSKEVENGCTDGRDGNSGKDGRRGRRGSDGSDGRNGSSGYDGASGSDGWDGSSGTISLLHIDNNGKVIKKYSLDDRFQINVTSFEVTDENNDGIFEPGEKLTISNIKVKNNGDMLAPASGSVVFNGVTILNSSLEPLPAINPITEYTLKGTVSARVPTNTPLAKKISVYPKTYMRGLIFDGSQFTKQLTIQYPIVISKVESVSHIEYANDNLLRFTVKNISQKQHKNIRLNHVLTGDISYKVVKSISQINAGSTAVETIEYRADKSVAPYHLSTLTTQLFRGSKLYQNNNNKWQVVPSYVNDSASNGVIVFNKQNQSNFLSLSNMLDSANLKFDIFDLRVNDISKLNVNLYKNKTLLIVAGTQLTSTQNSYVNSSLLTELSAGGFNITPNVKSPNYKFRRNFNLENYFELSSPVERLRAVILDVLPLQQKFEKHIQYYSEGKNELLGLAEASIIHTLEAEYSLARDSFKIYSKGSPLIVDYANYSLSLDPTADFGYRAQTLSLQPRIDDFLKAGRAGRKVRNDFLPQIEAAFKDLIKLGDSCGEIKGTYKNSTGEVWTFKYTLFRKVKAHNADKSLKLKGKNSDDNFWSLAYDIDGDKYAAEVNMICNEDTSIIELNIQLPHSGEVIELIKVATK